MDRQKNVKSANEGEVVYAQKNRISPTRDEGLFDRSGGHSAAGKPGARRAKACENLRQRGSEAAGCAQERRNG